MQAALFPSHKQRLSAVLGPQGKLFSPKLLPLEMQEGEAKWAQEGWEGGGKGVVMGCIPLGLLHIPPDRLCPCLSIGPQAHALPICPLGFPHPFL